MSSESEKSPSARDGAPAAAEVTLGRRSLIWIGFVFLGYAGLSHYSNSAPNAKGLAVGLSIGPILLIGLLLMWRWRGVLAAAVMTAVAAAFIYRYLSALEQHYELLDLVQQCGVYGLLAASFARSLAPGQVPLCSQLAVKMHGALEPIEMRYTWRATIAWMMFYLALIAVIIVLFLEAPLRVWSLFVNFIAFGLILLAGLGDYALRRLVLPPRPSGGLVGILQRALIG